jgi:hypothetical protein
LNDKGAKLIGLTIPPANEDINPAFKELKKLSNKINAYPPAERSPELKEWILQNLSDIENNLGSDSRLMNALNKGNVIIPVIAGNIRNRSLTDSPELSSEYFLNGSNITSSFHEKIKEDKLVFPVDNLLKNSSGLGHIISVYDESIDNSYYPVFLSSSGNLVPSLPLRMALSYLNIKPPQVLAGEQQLLLNDNPLPLINGLLYDPVNGRKDNELRTFSYSEIMNRDEAAIKGKVIFKLSKK